jgi:hypothetical protein
MCKKHYKRWYRANPNKKDARYTNRKAIIKGDVALIPLGNSDKPVIVDVDNAYVDKYGWSKNNSGYAIARIKNKAVLLHVLLFGKDKDLVNDHIDRDKLNNRKSNIRKVGNSTNAKNCKLSKNNTSGHNGVSWYEPYNKWVASGYDNYKRKTLGYFKDIQDAIKARAEYDHHLMAETNVLDDDILK